MNSDKKPKNELSKGFMQGYACAVATLARIEGGVDTRCRELMGAAGLTPESCASHEVSEYDTEILFPKRKA